MIVEFQSRPWSLRHRRSCQSFKDFKHFCPVLLRVHPTPEYHGRRMVSLSPAFQANSPSYGQESWSSRELRYNPTSSLHHKPRLSSFGHRNQFWLLSLHTAWWCRCVHLCGYQCSGLCETRHPAVHQHEARLQGDAHWCNPEQRAEPGPVLPRSGNSTSCHLLDRQQQSLHRYYLPLNSEHFNTTKVLRCHCDTKMHPNAPLSPEETEFWGSPAYLFLSQTAVYNTGIILVGKVIVGQQYLSQGKKQRL